MQTPTETPAAAIPAPQNHHTAYCEQRSLAEGSSFYYVTLFVPPARRNAWLGVLTLVRDIQAIPASVSDAGLAAIKLAWWKTEMDKAVQGSASHPVTLCMGADTVRSIGPDAVGRLVEAVSGGLQWPRYFTQSDWDTACAHWGGEAYLMAARALGVPAGLADDGVRQFGAASMRLTQLLMLAPALSAGWHPFPVDRLQQAGVSAESLRRRESGEALQRLIETCASQARNEGEGAWQGLPRPTRLALRPLRGLWRMRIAELELARQAGYPLLTERIRLTPLKKFWLAWSSHVLRR